MAEISKNLMCINCKFRQSTFDILLPGELDILNRNRFEVSYKKGETIFKQGSGLTHIACLTGGMAKIYIEGLNGKNLLLKIASKGEMVAGPGMHTDYKHHFTLTALDDVKVCLIDVDAFLGVLKTNSKFALAIMEKVNHQGIKNHEKFITLTQKQMHGRIADAIFYLADDIYKAKDFETQLSRQDLADMSAMTKESAIRILREFKDAGLISVVGNHFTILNRDALKKISING